ncbi:lysine N(6)-hydroxylase/L-ornithine N(5)-oxygenase family protein [Streptomyces sp. NBC_01257]|uniref:lysine N(6)-hydroxylase/L-ornithine N(5)-oxygenase family protein n=1 Tax=Streptomyces sp. NBC_01257 TaxID=2903799 RepID=UPI002DD9919F|nr:SidA/IucD/PvdA family monooxygenase [Streptomyces sp. NBC_01257]WRZ65707.1 SidA/IucD/PvdA family monooxygenase [Streptomyces sp. NBC_01257]
MNSRRAVPHFRCVGVGAGPANLSLASLLHGRPDVPNLFVDKKEHFSWHDGQQLHGALLQVSLFKDLVTLADPTNPFSFLSYLHASGRIYHFLNASFDAVPRQEFRNYLEWASRRNENVTFGEKVLSVEFDEHFVVHTDRRVVRADNIAIGVGSRAWVPPAARDALGRTQFHVADFAPRAAELAGRRVCVVGGGQSGAEAFLDLISRPDSERPAQVTWVSRRANFLPIDDSPFTNEYYVPAHSDYFASLDGDARGAFTERQVLTSDGISESTLREIYQRLYFLRFVLAGRPRGGFGLLPNRHVREVKGSDTSGWELTLDHHEQPFAAETLACDTVVWATGFRPVGTDFLAPLAERLERAGTEYRIDRDFAVQWDGPADRNIFLQNAARQQRGLADPNLSLNAWRSRRIADRILGTRTSDPYPSFVQWAADQPGVEDQEA